jgi:hypothetical protein
MHLRLHTIRHGTNPIWREPEIERVPVGANGAPIFRWILRDNEVTLASQIPSRDGQQLCPRDPIAINESLLGTTTPGTYESDSGDSAQAGIVRPKR